MIRSYSELRRLDTFEERYRYLKLHAGVGETTFGTDRYINQRFYKSYQWRQVRDLVITRDEGCDLGIEGFEIYDKIIIHHMNPMVRDDLVHGNPDILDPEFLVVVSHETHNAIHYGDDSLLNLRFVERAPGDTRLW